MDSSIVNCAAAARRQKPAPITGDIRMPYATLRTPSSDADAMAAGAAATPPAAMTPTKANCEPPVNISRLSTQVCQTSRPAATASAPNEMPYALVASATPSPWRQARRLSASGDRQARQSPARAYRGMPRRVSVPIGIRGPAAGPAVDQTLASWRFRREVARARSVWSRFTLRMRTISGVTSTHSSSRANSRLSSSESWRGGVIDSNVSEVD